MKRENIVQITFRFFLFVMLSALFISCNKESSVPDVKQEGEVLIGVRASLGSYVVDDISNFARIGGSNKYHSSLKDTIVDLGDGYELVASLVAEVDVSSGVSSSKIIPKSSSSARNLSALSPDDPFLGKSYKLLVFTKDPDQFVAERTYIRGRESETAVLKLKDGVEYVFVFFSLNDDSSLAGLVQNSGGNSLSNYQIVLPNSDESADIDLLYKKLNVAIPPEATSYDLQVQLEHQFNQVSVTISSYNIAQSITEAVGTLHARDHKSVQFSLADGSIVRPSASPVERLMPAPMLAGDITDTVVRMVANLNSATIGTAGYLFTLSNLKIQGRSQAIATKSFFPNQSLVKGVRYNVRIKVNCSACDGYTDGTIPTVRIGDQIWMRHNLKSGGGYGANPLPAANAVTSAVHGDYYQHSSKVAIASATDTTNSKRNTSMDYYSWNPNIRSGSPKKGYADPCPDGFRVPSPEEFGVLFGNVNRANHGTVTSSPTNFAGGTMLTSKTNANIKIFFPHQGYFEGGDYISSAVLHPIVNRGSYGYYLTSFVEESNTGTVHYANLVLLSTERYIPTNSAYQTSDIAQQYSRWGVKTPLKCISTYKDPQ